eukprot:SAG31_NODE_21888_length_538_cov_1.341686_1_plen_88_part_00
MGKQRCQHRAIKVVSCAAAEVAKCDVGRTLVAFSMSFSSCPRQLSKEARENVAGLAQNHSSTRTLVIRPCSGHMRLRQKSTGDVYWN